MSFLSACSLARIYAVSGRQLRTGFIARAQQQQTAACSSSSSVQPKEPPKTPTSPTQDINVSSRTHRPNDFEKRLLVFTKKYKTTDEIPQYINQDVMERCRNQVRIKIANYMMLATAIGCIIMIISGKKAQERGDSVQKMNLDWHKEYNDKARKEVAEATKN
ncbi:AAEL002350-PA [Aedes aegypti]|uniref:AAEL002350-PA n=2 Tax=Aedes aegypti TaxID=7159 RepID=Q17IH4_AEDAE